MEHGIEQPLAPTLGALAVARILWEVGNHTGRQDPLPLVRRIQAARQLERGPAENPPALLRHLFERRQACREPDPVGLLPRSHRARRSDVALRIDDGNALVALLLFVARVAPPIAPF